MDSAHLQSHKARISHTSQMVFYFLMVYLVLVTFERVVAREGALLGGDNRTALKNALTFCRRHVNQLRVPRNCFEKVLRGWKFLPVYFPKEFNHVADALSRLAAPDALERPSSALGNAAFRAVPVQDESLWLARYDRAPVA